MKTLSIPVRVVGPGSQVEEEALQYLDMSRDMNTFQMPLVPERVDVAALSESRDKLKELLAVLEPWDPAVSDLGPRIDVSGLSPAAIEITDQMLGEGEVSIKVDGARKARIQESVFAGIWRVCELDAAGRLIGDWIEAASLPAIVHEEARCATSPSPRPVAIPEGAMNSPALLNEIADRMVHRRSGTPAHVINLTLFPLTPEDHQVLEHALPVGPIGIISRGFGNCRISSTLARNVWRVQYFNTMNTLILNTLEVVEAPEVARAAVEDLIDSRERLAELVAWMGESCTA